MAAAEETIAVGPSLRGQTGSLTRGLLSSPFLGVLLAMVVWPIVSIEPAIGPDASWVAGLYMAHDAHLQFGREFVFTYGPLGFLEVPALYDQGLWALAYAYQALLHVALAISLLWVARRSLPLPLALLACFCLLVVGPLNAAVVLLAFLWCFVATDSWQPQRLALLVPAACGALGAVELLGKANYGIAVLAFGAIAAGAVEQRRRAAPAFALAAAATFAFGWLATGQGFTQVPAFIERGAEIVSGYSGAMGTDIVAHPWELVAAAVAGIAVIVLAAFATRREQLPLRIGATALVGVFLFLVFKQGFVRQGIGNTPEFFVLLAAAGLVVSSRLPRRRDGAYAVALAGPLIALALFVLPSPSLWSSLRVQPHLDSMREGLSTLFDTGKQVRTMAEARREMRASYRVPPAILAALGEQTVHIDPWEVGVAWAYRLNWHPLPAMQSYLAYTPGLDHLNARALRGEDGPQAILRHGPIGSGIASIDGRYPGWEPPLAMRTMLCDYRPASGSGRWELLERAGDRCGPPQALGTVAAASGETIAIPAAPRSGEMVFARISGIGVEGGEKLRALLYRARERTVRLDGSRSWRLVPATAGDGIVLRAPADRDYPPPFRIAPNAKTMALTVAGTERRLRVSFFAQPLGKFAAGSRDSAHPGPQPRPRRRR